MQSGAQKQDSASKREAYKNSKSSAQTTATRNLQQESKNQSSTQHQGSSRTNTTNGASTTSFVLSRSSSRGSQSDNEFKFASTAPNLRSAPATSAATSSANNLVVNPEWVQFHQQTMENGGFFKISLGMNFDAACRWLASSPAGVKKVLFDSQYQQPANAIALVEALKDNKIVTVLNLGSNKIGDDEAKVIANVLKNNTTLTALFLDNNEIGHEGAMAIAEALKSNKTLTQLGIVANNIGNKGVEALAAALNVNTTLTILDFFRNHFDDVTSGLNIMYELDKNRLLTIDEEGAKVALELINKELGKANNFGTLLYPREVMDQIIDQMGQASLKVEIINLGKSIKPKTKFKT